MNYVTLPPGLAEAIARPVTSIADARRRLEVTVRDERGGVAIVPLDAVRLLLDYAEILESHVRPEIITRCNAVRTVSRSGVPIVRRRR